MRRLIARILAWFLRDYIIAGNALVLSANEYVQIQKASWNRKDQMWDVQVRVFTVDGTIIGKVQVADLAKIHVREAAARRNT